MFFSPFSIAITSLEEEKERANLGAFLYVCSIFACLVLSVSSSSWCLGKAAACDCGTPWIFLLPFFKNTNAWKDVKNKTTVIELKSNSTERFKNILRHELQLKWIKRLQTPFRLGFNDNIYHEGNISKMPDFDAFSLLDIKKRNKRSHG